MKWQKAGAVNYFSVAAFRAVGPDKTVKKGQDEGSETTLIWRSGFSPCDGTVADITEANIVVETADGRRQRRGRKSLSALVANGDAVLFNQLVACNVTPTRGAELGCTGHLDTAGISEMLIDTHLPVRFAGVKLARVRGEAALRPAIEAMSVNADEDVYVRLEAKAYLASVHGEDITSLFATDLAAMDKSDQLEAVIAIGEVGSEQAAAVLSIVLGDNSKDYFLRSAAAYCLGRIHSAVSREALVRAFTAQTYRVREDALAALADVGFAALAELLAGLQHTDEEIQAGCAEVIRWLTTRSDRSLLESHIIPPLTAILARPDRSLMSVWLGGQIPERLMQAALTEVLGSDARLAYSLAVSWAFARSWIAPLHDSFQTLKK